LIYSLRPWEIYFPAILPHKATVDMIWEKDNYTISSDKKDVDIDSLHDMLSRSYWATYRSREDVEKSVANSLCFSLLKDNEQIGFARVLTDAMAYAIILDMIIREGFRGQGLGKWLMQCICDHPEVSPLRQVLWTGGADKFYRTVGFEDMSTLKFMARNWEM
jgi:GNAT superfamily N-acetyltransferase